MFSSVTIIFFIIAAVIILWWLQHTKAREGSLAAVKAACKAKDYQLLDDAIHLQKVRLQRINGNPCVRWIFYFDYYNEVERCRGTVYWRCAKLEKIEFVAPAKPRDATNKNVVSLDDYRRN